MNDSRHDRPAEEFQYPRSIGDDYDEYVDDEYGYQYHAWEVISASESARHDAIRLASKEELPHFEEDPAALTDLERWALARRRLHLGDQDRYLELVEPILTGPVDHPSLLYPEIFADAARQYARLNDLPRARGLVEEIGEKWPPFKEALPLLQAQLLLFAGDPAAADQKYEELIAPSPDVDLILEIAEDFAAQGQKDFAVNWLQRAEEEARSSGDTASLVDVELLRASLAQS